MSPQYLYSGFTAQDDRPSGQAGFISTVTELPMVAIPSNIVPSNDARAPEERAPEDRFVEAGARGNCT